jgi:hypothetical protein
MARRHRASGELICRLVFRCDTFQRRQHSKSVRGRLASLDRERPGVKGGVNTVGREQLRCIRIRVRCEQLRWESFRQRSESLLQRSSDVNRVGLCACPRSPRLPQQDTGRSSRENQCKQLHLIVPLWLIYTPFTGRCPGDLERLERLSASAASGLFFRSERSDFRLSASGGSDSGLSRTKSPK